MLEDFLQILLFGIAAAFGAATIALLLVFLQQRGYLKLAVAIVLGMILMQYLQGIMITSLPRLQEMANGTGSNVPARPLLMALLGALMLYGAWNQLRGSGGDAINQRLGRLMPRIGFFAAFGVGILLVLTNIKIWALAVATIEMTRDMEESVPMAALTYTLFVLMSQVLLLAFVLAQVLAPNRTKASLDRLSGWLQRNGNYVIAAVSGVIGLYFFVHGVYYLIFT
jgi:hypothetical protein